MKRFSRVPNNKAIARFECATIATINAAPTYLTAQPSNQLRNRFEHELFFGDLTEDYSEKKEKQSRYDILCLDSSPASANGGCFPGDSIVQVPGGSIRMDQLKPGDKVYSVDSNGKVVEDRILTFMDLKSDQTRGKKMKRLFTSIKTRSGAVKMTGNHLIFKANDYKTIPEDKLISSSNDTTDAYQSFFSFTVSFAAKMKAGDTIFKVYSSDDISTATIRQEIVTQVESVVSTSGAYAPLTTRGKIVVDNTLASCYAVIESHDLAHAVMTPYRYYHVIQTWERSRVQDLPGPRYNSNLNESISEGISFYAQVLFDIGALFIPGTYFWAN